MVVPAVKGYALAKDIHVFQPARLDAEALDLIASLKPDGLVVAAYGLIIPSAILAIPPLGAINVHASLLPRYRGAAPIQRAILNAEKATGITIMQMDEGMDTGPILLQQALAIGIDDTAATLHDQLAEMGGRLLVQALQRLLDGTLRSIPQDHALASYAPKLEKKEGQIIWEQSALKIHNHIRAMHPWPGAFFDWKRPVRGQPLRLHIAPGHVGQETKGHVAAGTIEGVHKDFLSIACQDRYYLTPQIKPASGKWITASEFDRGYLSS